MPSYKPLSDQALLANCANESEAGRLAGAVRQLGPPWLVDVVQAYSTVAVFFDLERIRYDSVREVVRDALARPAAKAAIGPGKLHVIPCCYELQLDLDRVAKQMGLSAKEVVRLHSETEYTVYAIGFCPGFPYLGYLPALLSGVPRLETPRLRVEPGSVGVAGRQTGIYTMARPAGWQLIGRTPLELVHVEDGYFPLRTGDRVRFEGIDREMYRRLEGKRMEKS